jgi:hypothetical protein
MGLYARARPEPCKRTDQGEIIVIVNITLIYDVENPEAHALNVLREVYDYANKGLRSASIDIERET